LITGTFLISANGTVILENKENLNDAHVNHRTDTKAVSIQIT
jgi:hypothetical protein